MYAYVLQSNDFLLTNVFSQQIVTNLMLLFWWVWLAIDNLLEYHIICTDGVKEIHLDHLQATLVAGIYSHILLL